MRMAILICHGWEPMTLEQPAPCFECCTENEFLEVTGLERNKTGDIIDKDGQVLLTAAGYTAAEKKVAGTFTLYSLSLSRNVLDSVLNSVLCR